MKRFLRMKVKKVHSKRKSLPIWKTPRRMQILNLRKIPMKVLKKVKKRHLKVEIYKKKKVILTMIRTKCSTQLLQG